MFAEKREIHDQQEDEDYDLEGSDPEDDLDAVPSLDPDPTEEDDEVVDIAAVTSEEEDSDDGDDGDTGDEEDEDDGGAAHDDDESTSLEELLARRSAARRGTDDSDDEGDIMSFPTDSARSRERLSIRVTPMKDQQEFVCRRCFLVKPRVQLADPERMLCRDCV